MTYGNMSIRTYRSNAEILGPNGFITVNYTGDDLLYWTCGGAGEFQTYKEAMQDYEQTLRDELVPGMREIGLNADEIAWAIWVIVGCADDTISSTYD